MSARRRSASSVGGRTVRSSRPDGSTSRAAVPSRPTSGCASRYATCRARRSGNATSSASSRASKGARARARAPVQGGGEAAARAPFYAQPRIAERFQDGRRPVGGAVVDDDELEIGQGLPEHAAHRFPHARRPVPDAHEHRHRGGGHRGAASLRRVSALRFLRRRLRYGRASDGDSPIRRSPPQTRPKAGRTLRRMRERAVSRKKLPAEARLLRHVLETAPARRGQALRERRVSPARPVHDEARVVDTAHAPRPAELGVREGEGGGQPLDQGQAHGVRLEREEAIGRVENGDVAARREHAIVLVHDLPAAAHGQMLDHSEDEHDVEAPVGIGEPPRLLVGQELHVAHATEPHLLDLHPHHGREGGVRLEGNDLPHQGLLGEVLRDVAERAADLEHAEIAGAAARADRRRAGRGNGGPASPCRRSTGGRARDPCARRASGRAARCTSSGSRVRPR